MIYFLFRAKTDGSEVCGSHGSETKKLIWMNAVQGLNLISSRLMSEHASAKYDEEKVFRREKKKEE